MGRTNPTFRDFLRKYEEQWQPYRRALRRGETAHFDRLFEGAQGYADAAGYLNGEDPGRVVLFSMLMAQAAELDGLRERVRELEDEG